MTTLTRRGTTPELNLGTKMVPPKLLWRVWVVGRLLARALGRGRRHAERSERAERGICAEHACIVRGNSQEHANIFRVCIFG